MQKKTLALKCISRSLKVKHLTWTESTVYILQFCCWQHGSFKFHGKLQKTCDWHSRMHNDTSRSSKV